jgi:hypothetical protein
MSARTIWGGVGEGGGGRERERESARERELFKEFKEFAFPDVITWKNNNIFYFMNEGGKNR